MSVTFLVECDSCRAAYIKADETQIAAALDYIRSRGWSMVIRGDTGLATMCPRCTRHRKEHTA